MVTAEVDSATLRHPRYRAGVELGRGAQGTVLQVQDCEDPERALVAKLYRPGLLNEANLRSEFALLARMRVPGLVRAHDLCRNEIDGAPFLVEDRIDGPDAGAWVQAAVETRLERLLRVLSATARSLAALHEAGFLHGDLKPAHLRIAGEQPVLLDLGAAIRSVHDARTRGFTRSYAAPEIVAGGRADARGDLYSLGALAWAAAVGGVPGARPEPLRSRAPWVAPSVADIIDTLLAAHPQDRVQSALELLGLLGQAAHSAGSLPTPIGRSAELQRLLVRGDGRVRYLVGESGSGKSHLLRELRVAALLSGRSARLLVPREDSAAYVAQWVALLRGERSFARDAPSLLLVDGLEDAPSDLISALESQRVLRPSGVTLQIIAASRSAPPGAEAIELGPLSSPDLFALAQALGVPEPARERLVSSAAGSPGWLVAALGRVPITSQAVLARTRDLPERARTALAALAAVGGSAPTAWLTALGLDVEEACSSALEAGLLGRRASAHEQRYEIAAPSLCAELVRALATPQLIAKLADVLLALSDAPPHALLALAGCAEPKLQPALRSAAASAARRAEARDLEIDALLGLGADPAAHSFTLLARLERLLRDAGRHSEHATVVSWLEAAADRDERIRALSLRRSAEQRARAGDKAAALSLADAALALAHACQEPLLIANALATRGAVQLFSADHAAAALDLADARSRFAALESVDDREELARLDHNLGVVALYRGELEQADACFRAALLAKQALGDRAGMRACLRNLGYTALRAERYDEAAAWLEQALALARSLRQKAGEAWSLVTLAEVAARRGQRDQSDRHLAEIEALGPEVPAAVRADVALVRAELALAVADFGAFDLALGSLDASACSADAQVDASRLILLSRASLARAASEPGQLRAAIRAALAALRRARAAQLVAATRDAQRALRAAWQARTARRVVPAAGSREFRPLATDFIAALGALPAAEIPRAFAGHLLATLGAERVFMLRFEGERLCDSWGIDMDGLGIAQPEQRVDLPALRALLSSADSEPLPRPCGRGTRLLLVSRPAGERAQHDTERLVAVAEQRFLPDAFAHVSAERARELNALLTLTARLALGASATGRHMPGPIDAPLAAAGVGDTSRTDDAVNTSTALPTIAARHSFPNIVGSSRALRAALARLDAAIDSNLPLLLSGETGVGKELFARAVAESGPRRGGPFVAVNCAAISSSLFEAEFFGHERGAFTGADRRRSGVFVQADTGVLLLDEIGELPLAQQAVLLRALETGRVRPLGAEREQQFDVRLIAASNRDLEHAASDGRFRRDLLYRINVVEVRIPALRERAEDIELLAMHFLRAQGSALTISPKALALLQAYPWPGNIRELAHTMQRLSALHERQIDVAQLPRQIRSARGRSDVTRAAVPAAVPDPTREVLQTLEQTGGNISQAARLLGLTRHGLKKRMLRLGLRGSSRGEPA